MRNNIIKLMESGITAHTVALKTGLPRNTVYRLFSGESSLDNITLKNAEILSAYWEEIKLKNMIDVIDVRDIVDEEGFDYWFIELNKTTDSTTFNNLGVKNVWIKKVDVQDDEIEKVYYAVSIETVYGVTKTSNDVEQILDVLHYNAIYDAGDFEYKAFFESEEEARKYALEKYPKRDIIELVKALKA